jgi:hypothetical protein
VPGGLIENGGKVCGGRHEESLFDWQQE